MQGHSWTASNLATAFLLLFSGCAADVDTDEGSEGAHGGAAAHADASQAEVNQRLLDLGFDLEKAEFDGNIIRFGDAVLFRDKLLSGAYDLSLAPYDGPEKAHYVGGGMPVTALNALDIKLAWSTNTSDAPTTTIKNAFIDAAGDFNATCGAAAPNDCYVHISQNNTGPWIVIHEVPANAWPPFACTSTQTACALWPSNGSPGGHIYVKKSNLTSSCTTWTANALKHVARHELSHALGFKHPGDGTLVPGTTSQVATPSKTVMNEIGFDSSCNYAPTLLQTDDKLGLRKLYDVP